MRDCSRGSRLLERIEGFDRRVAVEHDVLSGRRVKMSGSICSRKRWRLVVFVAGLECAKLVEKRKDAEAGVGVLAKGGGAISVEEERGGDGLKV